MNDQTHIPPVVSVLGHVDHGKTTLLDAIRKSNIAAREHGGITQKIGASRVEIVHDGQKQAITFIDTPGHEAFSQMRSRGVQAADIGILVVSSVDGVMPQTKEAIKLLQKDSLPFIVALTKSDVADKNVEKVKQQLVRENVLLEGYGGDVPIMEVSARNNTNIKELLDLILLMWEMKPSASDIEKKPLQAVIIESKLDPRSGPRATVVIKSGAIAVKDEVMTPEAHGKVRSLITDTGEFIQKASVGEAIEILGFEKVPQVGSIVQSKNELSKIEEKVQTNGAAMPQLSESDQGKSLYLILVADTFGSLEAIVQAVPKEVNVLVQKTGDVSEADILMAKSTGAIVLTFNIKLKPDIVKFASIEKILLKNYTIIYEMLDEIQQVIEGKALAMMEQIFGTARLEATFPFEKTIVLGVSVLDGRVARGDKIRLIRGEQVIGESSIVSLRQGKNQVSKVEKGQECGILISPALDFTIGDMIICHS